MNEIQKKLIIVGIVFGLLFFVLTTITQFKNLEKQKEECSKFEKQYNLIVNKNFSHFSDLSNNYCRIVMSDGTEVNIEDFNIAMIKTPLTYEVRKNYEG